MFSKQKIEVSINARNFRKFYGKFFSKICLKTEKYGNI
jgi:hypothetical protein